MQIYYLDTYCIWKCNHVFNFKIFLFLDYFQKFKKGSFRELKRLEFLTNLSKNTEMSGESKVETWETIWKANKIDMNSSKLIEVFIRYYSTVEYDSKYKLLYVFQKI